MYRSTSELAEATLFEHRMDADAFREDIRGDLEEGQQVMIYFSTWDNMYYLAVVDSFLRRLGYVCVC